VLSNSGAIAWAEFDQITIVSQYDVIKMQSKDPDIDFRRGERKI
jgi:hypothetical protein